MTRRYEPEPMPTRLVLPEKILDRCCVILTDIRLQRELSVRDLEQELRGRVANSTIYSWERGARSPNLPGLLEWCFALNVDPGWLIKTAALEVREDEHGL